MYCIAYFLWGDLVRMPPEYPLFPSISPMKVKRWYQWLLIIIAAALVATNLFWPEDQPAKTPLFWGVSLIIPTLLWSFVFLLSLFAKKLTLYNRAIYLKAIEEDEARWWTYQSAKLPIENTLIIGCLGDNQDEWSMLLSEMPTPPTPCLLDNQPVLSCPLFLGDRRNREKIGVKLLANQLVKAWHLDETERSMSHLYWLGSSDSMTLFVDCLQALHITPAPKRKNIQSIQDVDDIIDSYYGQCQNNQYLLVAGITQYDTTQETPIAEAGFVWLVSVEGTYALHRSEVVEPQEDRVSATTQLMKYAELNTPPAVILAMDSASAAALTASEWRNVDAMLAPYFGATTSLSPFLAITQGVAHCRQTHETSCGWISSMGKEQFITGVIKKDE